MTTSVQPFERPPIKPRKMNLAFGDDIPRHWVAGAAFPTALANALNLVFPLGERFFVRSVRAFADRIDDPMLADDVRGFVGQEVRHGIEHERFFDVLRAQGLDIDTFLRRYERLAYGVIEPRVSKKMRLAVTVALEHFTATFADAAFERGDAEKFFHPAMRDLLLWHAAEEIEHKAVAFEVLQRVDPSYALRMGGLFIATAGLLGFWAMGTASLLRQEKLSLREIVRQRREARERGDVASDDVARAFFAYLRPDFHPSDRDNYDVARRYFERIGVPDASQTAE